MPPEAEVFRNLFRDIEWCGTSVVVLGMLATLIVLGNEIKHGRWYQAVYGEDAPKRQSVLEPPEVLH